MRPATIVYISSAPQDLPPIFPQDLDVVRPDIEALKLEYDSNTQELRITITLVESNTPGGEVVRSMYDNMVVALVDHVSFELGFPLDSPRAIIYIEPSGSTTHFAAPAIAGALGRGFPVADQEGFRRRLSALLPTNPLLQEYNAAAHVSNPVHEFVAFWGLLTKITGEDRVTDYLHAQGITNEPGRREPKLKRIRNQIAHPKGRGVKLSEFPMLTIECLPELRGIVRRAITDKIQEVGITN